MLVLKQQDYERMIAHSQENLPNEACGLLGGVQEGSNIIVKKVYLLRNIDESREHFSMDPREQLEAVKDMRNNELQLIGNFHSHPETPSRPSQEDIRLAYDPNISYLILSLEKQEPILKAFEIRDGIVRQQELKIEG